MNRLFVAAALAVTLLTGCSKRGASGDGETGTPPATPVEFAGVVFEGLAKYDEPLFKRHYQQDLNVLVPFFRQVAGAEAKQKQRVSKPISDAELTKWIKNEHFPQTVDALSDLRGEGAKLGVDWSQVTNVKPEQLRPTDVVDGISLADCKVKFESKGSKFELDVGDVAKVGDKWTSNRLRINRTQ
jgi:hypothetical protein